MLVVKDPIPVEALCCPPVTAHQLDEATAIELAGVLKALADPVRLRLVSIVASAPAGESAPVTCLRCWSAPSRRSATTCPSWSRRG
jgi:hypothetical protein